MRHGLAACPSSRIPGSGDRSRSPRCSTVHPSPPTVGEPPAEVPAAVACTAAPGNPKLSSSATGSAAGAAPAAAGELALVSALGSSSTASLPWAGTPSEVACGAAASALTVQQPPSSPPSPVSFCCRCWLTVASGCSSLLVLAVQAGAAASAAARGCLPGLLHDAPAPASSSITCEAAGTVAPGGAAGLGAGAAPAGAADSAPPASTAHSSMRAAAAADPAAAAAGGA